jgi:hypothetical protein
MFIYNVVVGITVIVGSVSGTESSPVMITTRAPYLTLISSGKLRTYEVTPVIR